MAEIIRERPVIARSSPIGPSPIGIAQAHGTLSRAAAFFLDGPGRAGWTGGKLHAKVVGNGLRELDRFLSVLLDELAERSSHWPDDEVVAFARTRNTASKLALFSTRMGLPDPDLGGWRALGRCRDCLYYTGGVVRRADTRASTAMTLGWPGPAHARLGQPIPLTGPDVAWICALYRTTAADLVAAAAAPEMRPDGPAKDNPPAPMQSATFRAI